MILSLIYDELLARRISKYVIIKNKVCSTLNTNNLSVSSQTIGNLNLFRSSTEDIHKVFFLACNYVNGLYISWIYVCFHGFAQAFSSVFCKHLMKYNVVQTINGLFILQIASLLVGLLAACLQPTCQATDCLCLPAKTIFHKEANNRWANYPIYNINYLYM